MTRGVLNFRIPALAVAPNGDLLAAFDKRPVHGDSPAPNSIWQRRSRDGGLTWEEPTVVRAGLDSEVPGEKLGYSDPSYVVDTETGAIFLFSCPPRTPGCGTAPTATTTPTAT